MISNKIPIIKHFITLTVIVMLMIIIFSSNASAVPLEEWNKTYGGNEWENAYSVKQTSDGGFIFTGHIKSYGASWSDGWLVKTDSNGNELWNKTFGGPSRDDFSYVEQTNDGGYITAGYTYLSGDILSSGWFVKTDSNGNEIWNKTIGGDDNNVAEFVQQTSDGGYILTGYSGTYDISDIDYWVVKTDSQGNNLWDTTYTGTTDDFIECIRQTSDGGYILVGSTREFRAKDDSKVFLVKIDSNGNQIFDRTYGAKDCSYASSVFLTDDGGYIIVGETSSGDELIESLLIKTDSDGNQEWVKTFGNATKNIRTYDGQQTFDGGYILAGAIGSFLGDSGDTSWSNAIIIKTDSSGNEQWNITVGGDNNDWAYSIFQTTDGGYIISGFTDSYVTGFFNSGAWLIKIEGMDIDMQGEVEDISIITESNITELNDSSNEKSTPGFEMMMAILSILIIFTLKGRYD